MNPLPRGISFGTIVGLSALALAARPAAAGVIAPGESVLLPAADFAEPRGVLVAEQAIPFALPYRSNTGVSGGTISGQLDGSVYQDPFDGTLTFAYSVLVSDAGVRGSRLVVDGFGGAGADVSGRLTGASAAFFSALGTDGGSVEIANPPGVPGGPPILVVRTTATAFDAGGTANVWIDLDRLPAGTGEGDVGGVFRPAGGPVAVPLPPAAFSAAGVALAGGLIALARRRPAVNGRVP